MRTQALWITPIVLAVVGVGTAAREELRSQGTDEAKVPAAISPTVPPELVKPVLPSELDNAESVFRKLDVANRGYVTLEDTKDLLGFKDVFTRVDSERSGRLTLAQFRKAWSIYTEKR